MTQKLQSTVSKFTPIFRVARSLIRSILKYDSKFTFGYLKYKCETPIGVHKMQLFMGLHSINYRVLHRDNSLKLWLVVFGLKTTI